MNAKNLSPTLQQLASQFANPQGVAALTLLLGGDVVQKALAQTTGGHITPVCFSFGFAAYALKALSGLTGDGRLMPEPDHSVKVYNLQTGYVRENKNWTVGRVFRDNVFHLDSIKPLDDEALRISVYDAQPGTGDPSAAGRGNVLYSAIFTSLLQFGIASIPLVKNGDPGVLMVLAAGIQMALRAGALPQWRCEKLSGRRNSKKVFAMTAGNGSRDIMIIRGNGHCLDLEDLSMPEFPRSKRVWEAATWPATRTVKEPDTGKPVSRVVMLWGAPLGFRITLFASEVQTIGWTTMLIWIAGFRSDVWYLLAIGAIGFVHNFFVAAASRDPATRNMPLKHVETITRAKVMDGLMDLEVTYPHTGIVLLPEFFPGDLRDDEIKWWDEDTFPYDTKREEQAEWRGLPRTMMHSTPESSEDESEKVEGK
jgi:hypothetical protein